MKEIKDQFKVYQIKYHDGETEWVSARSIIEAIVILVQADRIGVYDLDYQDTIEEVPESKWDDLKITDEYGVLEMTFAEWMKLNKNSRDIIATTAE